MSAVTANWNITLDCHCPQCHEYVDVLDTPDFWDGRTMAIGEHGTDASKGVEVVCPECGHEFEVDCEY